MAPAVAALVAEVVRMDEEIAEAERAQVLASIAEKFELDAKEAADLMALAEEEARAATDFYQLTSQINFALSTAQKVKLIEHMWRAPTPTASRTKTRTTLSARSRSSSTCPIRSSSPPSSASGATPSRLLKTDPRGQAPIDGVRCRDHVGCYLR